MNVNGSNPSLQVATNKDDSDIQFYFMANVRAKFEVFLANIVCDLVAQSIISSFAINGELHR